MRLLGGQIGTVSAHDYGWGLGGEEGADEIGEQCRGGSIF